MVGVGLVTIAAASALGLVVVFVLWHRLPGVTAFALMAAGGVGVAVGGLLVQKGVETASWVVAIVVLAVLTPVHARLVFGPPGPRDVVAAGPAAA